MVGGYYQDTFIVDNPGDVITEADGNIGNDWVFTSITYILPSVIEEATLTGTADGDLTGNAADNFLNGNDGNNRLDGGGGNDSLYGGNGNDTYIVDQWAEGVYDSGGIDIIYSSANRELGYQSTGVENLVLTGTADIYGTGTDGDNIITAIPATISSTAGAATIL
ncbi:MAG: hypothetical protein WDN06_22250 [Asticcacaulis sp.]